MLTLLPGLAPAYEVAPVASPGRLGGRVTFQGVPPPPSRVLVAKDREVCGSGYREVVEVAVREQGLQGAVIVIDQVARGKPWPAAIEQPVLDQKGCRFLPPLLVVPQGASLEIQNSDPMLHNIHSYELTDGGRRTLFNLGQPKPARIQRPVRVPAGRWVKIECDAHRFMHAWLLPVASPYVALTQEDGRFLITGVPPGRHRVRALHPVLGARAAEVEISPGGDTSVAFEFAAP